MARDKRRSGRRRRSTTVSRQAGRVDTWGLAAVALGVRAGNRQRREALTMINALDDETLIAVLCQVARRAVRDGERSPRTRRGP